MDNKPTMSDVEVIHRDSNGTSYDKKGNPIKYSSAVYINDYEKTNASQKTFLMSDVGIPLTYSALYGVPDKDKDPLNYANVYPGPSNVHVNRPLTDFSVSYELEEGRFIGPAVSPIKTIQKRSDIYFRIARGDVTRTYGKEIERAIGAPANEFIQGFDTFNYSTVLYSGRLFMPDRTVSNADEALELQYNNTKFLQDIIEFAWDQRLAANYFTAAGGTANSLPGTTMTLAGGGKITAATTTNPYIQQSINYARAQMIQTNNGKAPTHIVMSSTLALAIAASNEVRGQIVFDPMGKEVVVAGGFPGPNYGLPKTLYGLTVVVESIPQNTAGVGVTDSFSDLIDNTLTLLIVDSPARRTMNAISTFRVDGFTVKAYRDETKEGAYVEVSVDQVETLTNQWGIYQLTACT